MIAPSTSSSGDLLQEIVASEGRLGFGDAKAYHNHYDEYSNTEVAKSDKNAANMASDVTIMLQADHDNQDGNKCDGMWAIDNKTRNRLARAMNGNGGGGKGAKGGGGRGGLGRFVQGAGLRTVLPTRGGVGPPAAAAVPSMTSPRPWYQDEPRARGGEQPAGQEPAGGRGEGAKGYADAYLAASATEDEQIA